MSVPNTLAGRAVHRMNGAGNRILVLDLRGTSVAPTSTDLRAIHAAPRLAFDQLMALFDARTRSSAAFVKIYNNDGSLAEACGNGTRCVADRLCRELHVDHVRIETQSGLIDCERLSDWRYRVDMSAPKLGWADIPLSRPVEDTRSVRLPWPAGDDLERLGPASLVNMGNPHAVFFVPDLAAVDAQGWGARIETHPLFPEKANVTFAQVHGPDAVTARVWERGVGLTLACGSAACATIVAASRLGLMNRKGVVRLPGGELVIEQRVSDDHVLMEGPVEYEAEFVLLDSVIHAPAL